MDARGITLRNVFLGAGLLLCILYGLLTVHHSQSLRAGETAWWNEFMALTVSEEYATGPRSFHILQEGEGKPYRIALAQMS